MNLFHEKNLFLTEAKTEIQLTVQPYFNSEKIMNSAAYYVCRIWREVQQVFQGPGVTITMVAM